VIPANARVDLQSNGTGRVEVDGVDVSKQVKALTLSASAGQQSELVLHFVLGGVAVSGEIDVVVDDETRWALVVLGWMPPEKPDHGETG